MDGSMGETYVVPISLAGGESSALEAKGTLPSSRARGVFGKRELARVVVP